MSATLLVSILAPVATLFASFFIADLHRQQNRQIELHRNDPSVPVVLLLIQSQDF
jgi:hypothetical protein